MNLGLTNKRVLITGSTSGIGFAIAEEFVHQGAKVVVNGRNSSSVDEVTNSLNCFGCAADAADPNEINYLLAKSIQMLGGLDILICNIGNGSSVLPGKETLEEWQRVFNLNFFSTTTMIEKATPYLKQSKGSIVCISSICGLEVIPGAPITYSVAKSALNAFIKGIARPLGEYEIRINAVAPGNIIFDGSSWQVKQDKDPLSVEQMLQDEVSMKRFGVPNEIADTTLFLSSHKSSFITGEIIKVDGGQARA